MKYKLFLVISISTLAVHAAPTMLKIQDVIELVQTQGLQQKDINLGYQKSEISGLLVESNFDTQMYLKAQNDDSKLEAPGLSFATRDQSQTIALGLSRKFTTGSTLGLDYSYVHKDMTLSPAMQSFPIQPIQYYHLTTLTFKQDLLNNSFGYKDRRQTLTASLQRERAKVEKDEASEELVLQTIKLYLDTYFAQENLKQSQAARDKYLLLLKSVQQKSRMGFDDRSELIKTKAELQNQERNLKSASLLYSSLVDKLYTLMNTPRPTEVTIDVNEVIPAPPSVETNAKLEELRKTQSSEILVKATEADKEASSNNEMASLNFFSQAVYSGLDKENSTAVSELKDREHPKYTFGLEFVMRWGASGQKAENLAKTVAYEEALNNQRKVQNDLTETLDRTQRNLQSKYNIAVNAQDTVKVWEEAMKSQERNHRFGRITTAELIMDYGSYFRAKSALSGAIAEYQLALFEFQAARDQLIKSNK